GVRGVNGSGVEGGCGSGPFLEYAHRANAETFVAIQSEHVDAVEDVERIAAVPDVDVLFGGPADLGQSMGLPGEWEHPRLWRAYARVAKAAQAGGIDLVILVGNHAHAERCGGMGWLLLSVGGG